MSVAIILCVLGFVVAIAAHVSSKAVERLARERYRDSVGESHASLDDSWREIRPLAGYWGCLFAGLRLLRSVGVVVALGAVLVLVIG